MDVYGKWVNKVLIVDTISDLPLMTRPPDSLPVSKLWGFGCFVPAEYFSPTRGVFLRINIVLTAHYCLGVFYPIITGFMKSLLAPVDV